MSYPPEERLAEAAKYEDQAKQLQEMALKIREEVKINCTHPYQYLTFNSGAWTSHLSDRVEQSMSVYCSLCNSCFQNKLVIHREP